MKLDHFKKGVLKLNNEKSKLIKELWQKAEKVLYALYGDMPNIQILNRFYSEKIAFCESDNIIIWDLVGAICIEALCLNYNVRPVGTVGSCFTAYLLGASRNNPLPLHFHCSSCGCTEFVDKSNALPFDIPSKTCVCGGVMRPEGFDIPYEMDISVSHAPHTSLWVSPKFLDEAKRMVFERMKNHYCVGELSNDMGYTKFVFLPRNSRAHFNEKVDVTDDRYIIFPSLTVGDNPVFEKAEKLTEKTGVDFYEIYSSNCKYYLSDKKIVREFASGNIDGIPYFYWKEPRYNKMKDVLKLVNPRSSYELLKVYSVLQCSHTWVEYCENLLLSGVCIADIPTTIEEVFMLVRDKLGYGGAIIACELANKICYNKLDANALAILSSLDLPKWFITYAKKMKFIHDKVRMVAFLREALAFMWYKINYPEVFKEIMTNYGM